MQKKISKFNFINSFLENVKKYPNNTFLVSDEEKIKYREFFDLCKKFKDYLVAHSGKKAPIVCIYETKKNFDYVSMIGTILAGGHYIPINKSIPIEKVKKILKVSKANFFSSSEIDKNIKQKLKKKIIFLTRDTILKKIKSKKKKYLPSKIAYILFTSGTTGEPKGVIITKKNLNIYLKWLTNTINIKNNEHCSQFISISFDVSVCDFYLTICSGGKLFIPNEFDMIFPGKMIFKNYISYLVCTPSLIDHIDNSNDLNKKNFKNVKKILFCGEPLFEKQVKKIFSVNSKIKIINAYGPTETTVSVTYSQINKQNYKKLSNGIMPIGKVIDNTKIILVNDKLQINKHEGEILISGMQLSPGYLSQISETKKKFIKINGTRYFRTGDFGFKFKDNLYFKQRIDDQIKFRGHRIELNEINFFLREFGLNNVYTNIYNNEIISFIQHHKIDIKQIKNYLKNKLEKYKIPNTFIFIKKFPLNKSGKIDINKIKLLVNK